MVLQDWDGWGPQDGALVRSLRSAREITSLQTSHCDVHRTDTGSSGWCLACWYGALRGSSAVFAGGVRLQGSLCGAPAHRGPAASLPAGSGAGTFQKFAPFSYRLVRYRYSSKCAAYFAQCAAKRGRSTFPLPAWKQAQTLEPFPQSCRGSSRTPRPMVPITFVLRPERLPCRPEGSAGEMFTSVRAANSSTCDRTVPVRRHAQETSPLLPSRALPQPCRC